MEKFLIEVPHGGDKMSCTQAIQIFLSSGSHFVTNAEWGCQAEAKITRINKFTRKDIEENIVDQHS